VATDGAAKLGRRAIWLPAAAAILDRETAALDALLIRHELVGGLMPRIAGWLLNRPLDPTDGGGTAMPMLITNYLASDWGKHERT
jgi:hypothetical protein